MGEWLRVRDAFLVPGSVVSITRCWYQRAELHNLRMAIIPLDGLLATGSPGLNLPAKTQSEKRKGAQEPDLSSVAFGAREVERHADEDNDSSNRAPEGCQYHVRTSNELSRITLNLLYSTHSPHGDE
jgi:hypothetical protein